LASALARTKTPAAPPQTAPPPPTALRYVPAAPQNKIEVEPLPVVNYETPAKENTYFSNTEATTTTPLAATATEENEVTENYEETDVAGVSAVSSEDDFGVYQVAPNEQPVFQQTHSRYILFLYNIGASGLAISLGIHAILLVLAFFVIATISTSSLERDFELPGGGGGKGGQVPHDEHRIQLAKRRVQERALDKIRVKGASRIALPDIPPEAKALSSALSNLKDASSGSGGGSGGGIGLGRGIGIGRGTGPGFGGGQGRVFVGRSVFGMKIRGSKIAVYFDNSQSLVPYLDTVKKLVYEKFPTADIFELPGAKTTVVENAILGGKHSGVGANSARAFGKGSTTKMGKLTPYGRELYKKYGPNFARGSVGAWVDVMLYEEYEALIIFSDFQDGFHDDGWVTVAGAETWKARWLAQFKKAKMDTREAPRLYLVSVQLPPQQEWQEFVDASGGEITIKDVHTKGVGILRDGGR
jgi:hypothetical protein